MWKERRVCERERERERRREREIEREREKEREKEREREIKRENERKKERKKEREHGSFSCIFLVKSISLLCSCLHHKFCSQMLSLLTFVIAN